MASTSRRTRSAGSRNFGTPYRSIPPGSGIASSTVTAQPSRARSCAQVIPATPAPTTAARFPFGVGVTDPAAVDISSVLRRSDAASTPNRSVVVRLIARIDTGRSMVPRRHAVSHGAPHTRPQMDANGFGPLAIRYARA